MISSLLVPPVGEVTNAAYNLGVSRMLARTLVIMWFLLVSFTGVFVALGFLGVVLMLFGGSMTLLLHLFAPREKSAKTTQ